ncbi:MAG: zinc ribbon domain-containing protein [Planctomycetes bacterium]|nr:zinc ribbon domain-containing protein [Planctomycetota bacterium]
MPLYEYKCGECGEVFEALLKMSERDTAPRCPSCGCETTGRLLSVFASHCSGGAGQGRGSCASCSGGSCSVCGL